MANNNGNLWQKLGKVLGGETNPMALEKSDIDGLITPEQPVEQTFQSLEEFQAELLKKQQEKFYGDQYKKITNDAYQKSVFYDSSRLASYIDYEQMEFYPEIKTALNIMAEESTCLYDNGKMLDIRSSSERIKNILDHLFNNILQINVTLPAWTRNVCKYGDNFVYLRSAQGKGIVKAMQMKNIEITRVEGDYGFNNSNDSETDHVKFEWKQRGEVFSDWQIAHFRLVGDDKRLPYGTSMIDGVRKVWKMLSLAEDAMMVYRISRAPERRVFKIDVGNIDPADVENYVQKIANKFKRTSQVNQKNGQIDFRYNMLTQDEDYFIPMRNGNNGTAIDTLQGAQNLSEIGDIEYLQGKLFSGLQVPKTFLGFGESAGDGKNLSMQDVRFARTVNRIQQAMLMELNKIAIIHLYLLGFEDELNNFSLALANPSSQAEMLKLEILGVKLDVFIKATTPIGDGGFAPMSYTEASKEILGKSDAEIVLSMQQQRLEKAEAIRNSPEILATKNLNSGIFNNLDKRYVDNTENNANNSMENPEGGAPGMGGGGGLPPSGGAGFGGDTELPGGEEGLPDMSNVDLPDAGNNLQERNTLLNENINKNIDTADKLLNQ